jgi:hypothetical protein
VGVVDSAGGGAESIVGDDRPVRGGDVDELRVPGDIPGGEDARVVRAQLLVDDDLPARAGLHAYMIKVEPGGDRPATGRDQDLVGSQDMIADVGAYGGHHAVAVALYCGELGAGVHRDALVGEHGLDPRGRLGFLERDQPSQRPPRR